MNPRIVPTVAMVALTAFAAPGATPATDLGAFLAEVEDAGRPEAPVRADLHVRVKEAEGERQYEGVAVYRGANVYVDLGKPAVRLLIRAGDKGDETVDQAYGDGTGSPVRGTAYDPIRGTTLIVDDFRPFRARTLRMPQITSETKRTLLVSGAPAEVSPYVLLVYLLDRETHLPTRVQYYERIASNLVRMRHDTDLVRIDGTWRPRRTEIEDYKTGAVTEIERRWTATPEVPPDLFDPAMLATRSPLGHP